MKASKKPDFDLSAIFNPLVKVSSGSSSSSTSSTYSSNQSSKIFELAKKLAAKYQGECVSSNFSICKGKTALKFRCVNQHTFYVPSDSLPQNLDNSDEAWCYKCRKFFDSCKVAAKETLIMVIDGLFKEKITMKCEARGHMIKIGYSKKLNSLQCAECRKEEREEWKE